MTDTYGTRGDAAQVILDLVGEYAADYDLDAALPELLTQDPDTGRWVIAYTSVDDIMGILDRHDITARQADEAQAAAEQHDVDAEALRQDLVAAARTTGRSLTVDDMTVAVNGEYAGGGLDEWPTGSSFWVTVTAPDGEAVRVGAEVGSWGGLLDVIREQCDEYRDREAVADRAHLANLERAAARHAAALTELAAARTALDPIIRANLDRGMTAYRAAQVTGLSQPSIARIRDAR